MDELDATFARLQAVIEEQHEAHDTLNDLSSAQPGTEVYDDIRACHDDKADPETEAREEIASLVTYSDTHHLGCADT